MKQKIDTLLKERGLKHGWAAWKIGVTDATLRNWKNKKTKPKESDARRLADLFGVGVDEIEFK